MTGESQFKVWKLFAVLAALLLSAVGITARFTHRNGLGQFSKIAARGSLEGARSGLMAAVPLNPSVVMPPVTLPAHMSERDAIEAAERINAQQMRQRREQWERTYRLWQQKGIR